MRLLRSHSLASDSLGTVDIKARWHTRQYTRNLVNFQIPWPLDFWQPSLPVSFVEDNSIVVPGLAGRTFDLPLSECDTDH